MHKRYLMSRILILLLLLNVTTAQLCNSKSPKERTLIKATDDFAEGQKSAANLLSKAKADGLISQEDINEIKPFLQQANDLNDEAIKFGKKLILNPNDTVSKNSAIDIINQISAVLVRANNAGLFRIKNRELQLAFSTVIIALQAAATSAITVLKQ